MQSGVLHSFEYSPNATENWTAWGNCPIFTKTKCQAANLVSRDLGGKIFITTDVKSLWGNFTTVSTMI